MVTEWVRVLWRWHRDQPAGTRVESSRLFFERRFRGKCEGAVIG